MLPQQTEESAVGKMPLIVKRVKKQLKFSLFLQHYE